MGYRDRCDCPRDRRLTAEATEALAFYHLQRHAGRTLRQLAEAQGLTLWQTQRLTNEGAAIVYCLGPHVGEWERWDAEQRYFVGGAGRPAPQEPEIGALGEALMAALRRRGE